MKTESVLKGVSSVEVTSANGTILCFDVVDFTVVADDGAPDGDDWTDWMDWAKYSDRFAPSPTIYAIKGRMEPNSEGICFTVQLPQKSVLRTATIEVESNTLPELERARKRCEAPSDARWDTDGDTVTFTWEEE